MDVARSAPAQQTLLTGRAIPTREFVVARNPDPDSSLPYILAVPAGAGLTLKAADSWPIGSRVYCHRVEEALGPEAEVLERVPVRMCVWRGRAIDLVLDRSRHNRSQFVFTTVRGRPAIFWQTAAVARKARPGLRLPVQRAASRLTIAVDTREQRPYAFARAGAELIRSRLFAGDYAVRGEHGIVAAVERKTLEDLVRSLSSGSLGFAMADLAALAAAAVVVEDVYSRLLMHPHVRGGRLVDLLTRLQVRHPGVSIVFADNRRLAEHWTYRFLAAANAEYGRTEP
jgi:hypothetical protein